MNHALETYTDLKHEALSQISIMQKTITLLGGEIDKAELKHQLQGLSDMWTVASLLDPEGIEAIIRSGNPQQAIMEAVLSVDPSTLAETVYDFIENYDSRVTQAKLNEIRIINTDMIKDFKASIKGLQAWVNACQKEMNKLKEGMNND